MQTAKPLLLVEDDYLDAAITRRSLQELKIRNPLIHKCNGEEALAYLNPPPREMPCVILLDLNMPRMNGFEFLSQIKAQGALKDIPTIILTTSTAHEDIEASLRLGAAGYIVKAMDISTFLKSLRSIECYCVCSDSACDDPKTCSMSNS